MKEVMAPNYPKPLGNPVIHSCVKDDNLYHCQATGRALTGIMHFLNNTPMDWYSKRQATVETATYGSEFVAAKIATEQIIDMRITLRYLGVPILDRSYLFGDNQAVVTSATIPHSVLTKRHNALGFHKVRESIAANILDFIWIKSAKNLSDLLSKHWDYASIHTTIIKLLEKRGPIVLIEPEL